MRKLIFMFFVFWWAMIFPSLSFNSFTTDIIDDNISYKDLYNHDSREKILENAEYRLFFSLS